MYGGEATELASMSRYLDNLKGSGDYKGIVYEMGNKLLDTLLKVNSR